MIPGFGITWGHVFLYEPLSGSIFAIGLLVLLAWHWQRVLIRYIDHHHSSRGPKHL